VRLRAYLLLLVAVGVLPVIVFAGALVALQIRGERQAVEQGLLTTTRALAAALDRELSDTIRTLQAMAITPLFQANDLAGFYEYARRVVASQPTWRTVFLLDEQGQQLVNTARPFGSELAPAADRTFFREVVQDRKPVISGYHVDRTTGLPTIVVAVPVLREGKVWSVLGVSFELTALGAIFTEQRLPDDWTGAILDRERRLVGRSRAPEQFLGRSATATLARRSEEADEGSFRDVTQEGIESFGVFVQSSLSGWTVVLGVPAEEVVAPGRRTLLAFGAAGLGFLGLGGVLALAFARRVAAPVAALTESTRRVERGEAAGPPPVTGVTEIRTLGEGLARASQARLRAEESLAVTLRSIGDGVIATDVEGRVTFMNATAETLTGWKAAEAQGRPLEEVFVILNEQTRGAVESPVARVLREGRVVGLANHTLLIARDGGEWPIEDSGAPMRDGAGTTTGVVLVFHDITERRAAEAREAESEGRFRLLADVVPVMIRVSGIDAKSHFFNNGWLAFTGRTVEEELGDGWTAGVHADDLARWLEVSMAAFDARQPFGTEYRLRRTDGQYRWVLDQGVPMVAPDGSFTGYIAAVIDIHDRRLAEEERSRRLVQVTEARDEAERGAELIRRLQRVTDAALAQLPFDDLLRELLLRVRDIVGTDTAAVLLLEPGGRWLAARAAVGLEEEVERGVRIPVGGGFAGRIAAESRPVIVDDVDHAQILNPILRQKGVRSLLGVPLAVEGRVIGVLHVGTLKPRRFTAADAELLQLVADRVALAIEHTRIHDAERRARSEAEAANRAKDDFLATLSHELRTPLNAILGWSRMLREGRLQPGQTTRALEVIERNALAQSQLISDLLDVSRIITGRVRLEMLSVDLPAVVEAAVDAIRPAAEAKGIRLDVEIEPDLGTVQGDPARLQQVLWNLVSNAVKFTPREGVIRVRAARRGSQVELGVSDTGVGIAPEALPYVFDRFHQADSTTTRLHGGLGLGLAIVRHLVELHGGTVHATSEGEGRGASFTVRIPFRGAVAKPAGVAAAAVGPARAAGPPPSLAGLRVLVVDDEPDARELLAAILDRAGAEVRVAASADEALTALEPAPADVIVSDIGMPDTDGYAMIRAIRTRQIATPALALTAYARYEDRQQALGAGFQAFVAKPVDPRELVRLVAALAGQGQTP
jgi:PAS domain S-box-containing protein